MGRSPSTRSGGGRAEPQLRARQEPTLDQVFPAAEREIFPYFNGVKEVKGDPLEIEARYLRELAGEDLGAIDKMLESPDVQTRLRGSDKMVPAIRAAFRLREFDEDTGGGLT